MTQQCIAPRISEDSPCRCGAHSQHQVYRYLFNHPGSPLRLVAQDLRMSHAAAKMAKSRLNRRKGIHLTCPECFTPSLRGLVCGNCGVELDTPSLPDGIRFDEATPVHSIQPLGGLGSATSYTRLPFQYGGRNISHLVERATDPLLERCKSALWQELKEVMPPDAVVEEATRLLIKSVREFEANYPALTRAKGAGSQLVENVLKLLRLRYPQLRKGNAVTVLQGESR